jgi:hypothetical protein
VGSSSRDQQAFHIYIYTVVHNVYFIYRKTEEHWLASVVYTYMHYMVCIKRIAAEGSSAAQGSRLNNHLSLLLFGFSLFFLLIFHFLRLLYALIVHDADFSIYIYICVMYTIILPIITHKK